MEREGKMEIEIKNKYLKKLIGYELNKNENSVIDREDLRKVKTIAINRYDLLGQGTNIELADLFFLTNLESCIISNYRITEKDIASLNDLTNLKTLQFSYCDFYHVMSKLNLNLNYLILETCKNVSLDIFSENRMIEKLRIIHDNIDIREIEKFNQIRRLYLQKCEISNANRITNLKQLQYINLEKSTMDNEDILRILRKTTNIEYEM